jgi:glycine dehydrogenase subunit 1
MQNFLALTEEDRKEMLKDISIDSIEELFIKIPKEAIITNFDLPEALSEMETQKEIKRVAKKNNIDMINFLGAGVYNHFIPACIAQVAQRFEFLTAYTPYQPEISQGTLQVMYEFQSMICNLTGMDVSNASVYDGASACAESILMASRITKRYKALVSDTINPEYKAVIKTYADAIGIKIDFLEYVDFKTDFEAFKNKIQAEEYSCILIQTPNYFGTIEEINLKEVLETSKTLLIACVNIASLAVLKAPCEYFADITVGDIQPLGIPMSFGGPHGGFMACREKFMRQLPGRIAGRTLDVDENQAFTLTIQTREQHIKREKATSNICSNQALITLCSTLYLTLLGEKGFRQAGILSMQNSRKLSKMLLEKGIKTLNKDFYNEFVIEVEDSDKFLADLKEKNILGGLKLDKKKILVATTEMNSEEELLLYCADL